MRLSAPGGFDVSHAVCCLAGDVDAWVFRLSRRRGANSPVANHCGNFLGDAPVQKSHRLGNILLFACFVGAFIDPKL